MAEVKHPEKEAPTMQVPQEETAFGADDAPTRSAEDMIAEVITRETAGPTLLPPMEEAAAAADEGISAWHNGKKITALWSNSAPRNGFIAVPGMGWKKLSNANDSSFLNMVMMASHAEQTNANVNIRIEADGMVHEIYVW